MYKQTENTTSTEELPILWLKHKVGSESHCVTMTTSLHTWGLLPPPPSSLEHTSLKGEKGNLLQLILWVAAGWPWLDSNDLVLHLTLFPGAASCGRRRFLPLLLPEELLKRFEFGLFLSYAERLCLSIYQTGTRCAWAGKWDFCLCINHSLLKSPSTLQDVKHTVYLETNLDFCLFWTLNKRTKKALEHDHRIIKARTIFLSLEINPI